MGTDMTKEEIYDSLIAPKLLEIGKLCQEHQLGFVFAVEYEPYGLGRTACYPADASYAIRLVDWATKSHGNADKLIFGMMKHGREHGHGSACLRMLGVDEKGGEQR